MLKLKELHYNKEQYELKVNSNLRTYNFIDKKTNLLYTLHGNILSIEQIGNTNEFLVYTLVRSIEYKFERVKLEKQKVISMFSISTHENFICLSEDTIFLSGVFNNLVYSISKNSFIDIPKWLKDKFIDIENTGRYTKDGHAIFKYSRTVGSFYTNIVEYIIIFFDAETFEFQSSAYSTFIPGYFTINSKFSLYDLYELTDKKMNAEYNKIKVKKKKALENAQFLMLS